MLLQRPMVILNGKGFFHSYAGMLPNEGQYPPDQAPVIGHAYMFGPHGDGRRHSNVLVVHGDHHEIDPNQSRLHWTVRPANGIASPA